MKLYRGIYTNNEGWTSSNWSRLVNAHKNLFADFADIEDYYQGSFNLITHGLLRVTGTLDPDATGLYYENGIFGGEPEYHRVDGAYYIRKDTAWGIVDSGVNSVWLGSDGDVSGEYTPFMSASGTATVTACTEGDYEPSTDDTRRDQAHACGVGYGYGYPTGADFLTRGNHFLQSDAVYYITRVSDGKRIDLTSQLGMLYYPGSPNSYKPTRDEIGRNVIHLFAPVDLTDVSRFGSISVGEEFTIEVEGLDNATYLEELTLDEFERMTDPQLAYLRTDNGFEFAPMGVGDIAGLTVPQAANLKI